MPGPWTRLIPIALVFCAVAAWPLAVQGGVTRGPFLQQLTTSSVSVVCEGTFDTLPHVALQGADDTSGTADCLCTPPHCSCPIAGLVEATGYNYQLLAGEAELGAGEFVTAPSSAVTFSFAVHGDNRSDHASHSLVIQNLTGEDFAFVVNTGDMVSDGEVESQWDDFFDIEGGLLASVPIYPAVGNHEEHEGDISIFERTFEMPAETSNSGEESYYSFDYANAHFVVLDDFVAIHPWYECLLIGKLYDNCLTSEQIAWLNVDLAKATANPAIDHVFVFAHEGPYSSKEGRSGSAAMRDLLPLFAKSKVKAIFSGHDHYFEHGVTGNGIDYVISGGGGAPLYDIAPGLLSQIAPHDVVMNKSTHNYQVVTVSGPYIQVVTRDVDEMNVLEEFEVGLPPACTVAADCAGEDEGSCAGSFECIDFACVWVCDGPPPCQTDADCPAPLDGDCDGAWQCSPENECVWVCEPEPECVIGADCLDKGPLNDCLAGIWQCMDEVCEWVCPPPLQPPEDVVEGPDVMTSPDQEGAPDTESDPDAAPVETTSDAVPGEGDSASKQPLHDVPAGKSSGGCSAAPAGAAIPSLLLALMVALMAARLRRRRC